MTRSRQDWDSDWESDSPAGRAMRLVEEMGYWMVFRGRRESVSLLALKLVRVRCRYIRNNRLL